MERYHYSTTGFPQEYVPAGIAARLSYSHHALRAAADDERGVIPILTYINTDDVEQQLIELDVKDEVVVKAVYRKPLDDNRDVIIVVIPKQGSQAWFVKTTWSLYRGEKPTHHTPMKG